MQRALSLGEIVNKEQLDVTDADVNAQIDKMSAQFGEQADIFRNMLLRNENKRGIAMDMITNRALQRLVQIARGENPAIGPTPEPEAPSEIVAVAGVEAPSSPINANTDANAAPAEAPAAPVDQPAASTESTPDSETKSS